MKTTVYQLHGQLTVFSLPPPQVPQWSGQTVHCFRPLRVSRLTHIHTLVLPAQRSSIPRCQFRYLRPLVPSITFRFWFTLYCFCPILFLPFSLFIPTMILLSAATDASTERHVVVASTERHVVVASTERHVVVASTERHVVVASTERHVVVASTERHVVVRLYSNCSMSDHKR